MSILNIENISKTYSDKVLFDKVSMIINEEDKIGLIGVNGTGKSTFLKIIAGVESPDEGEIKKSSKLVIEYLSQNPDYNEDNKVLEQVFKSDTKIMNLIREYENTLEEIQKNPTDEKLQEELLKLNTQMDINDAWSLESQVKTVLTKLGITQFDKKMKELSGGQRKRVFLASALITPCDLLILDEPTNHMDNNTIDWLEEYLKNRKGALLMITHDRYFLDRVSNKIMEIFAGNLYAYDGNYSQYLEKKVLREEQNSIIERKKQRLFKQELAWIRAGVQARGTKQKARKQRFEELKDSLNNDLKEDLDISIPTRRLGNKIVEVKNLKKSFEDKTVINDFTYTFLKEDRIGIIGNNGEGKSTLLNLITHKLEPTSGEIEIGDTVSIGYFSQESIEMDGNLRAIDFIKEQAEYVRTKENILISASTMMERFLFDSNLQYTYIYKLSGGEKRRLYLLSVLIKAPNVLILDEPTNDLDIDTLKVLEEYIDEFSGTVLIVSHDRYFLDRTCNKIFALKNGEFNVNVGNYTDFIEKFSDFNDEEIKSKKVTKEIKKPKSDNDLKLKFTYKEKMEFESLPKEVEEIENKLEQIDADLAIIVSDFVKLQELSKEKDELEELLLEKMERLEYFFDLEEEIKQNKLKK
ncbi:MAG: ABC-F family ATP-binding cassette domain-containing protein [Peptostreptococcaceae bacterium]|jgi:ATP-binding cassette subfamily F protein uup|nr:ABC-F family ATP-binding cassette domain-containing protein [Peptostreptococcaceae bacterium]